MIHHSWDFFQFLSTFETIYLKFDCKSVQCLCFLETVSVHFFCEMVLLSCFFACLITFSRKLDVDYYNVVTLAITCSPPFQCLLLLFAVIVSFLMTFLNTAKFVFFVMGDH